MKTIGIVQKPPCLTPLTLLKEVLDRIIDLVSTILKLVNMPGEFVVEVDRAQFCLKLEISGVNTFGWVEYTLSHALGELDQSLILTVDIKGQMRQHDFIRSKIVIDKGRWSLLGYHIWSH